MRTLLAATGVAVAATILGVGTYASQSDTVPSPAPTTSLAVDDNGGTTDRDDRVEPGDDRDMEGRMVSPDAYPSASTSPAGEDNGGETDRDNRVEPGDDRDSDTYTEDYEDADEDSWDDAEDRWDDSGHDD